MLKNDIIKEITLSFLYQRYRKNKLLFNFITFFNIINLAIEH